ncbi:MAG: type II toxin-antitoxin system VapC family toxin [Anaerolinea sp.]|nr:type II toxin-antitoxin system VapC family toxin [Anaerolinea sp.]
MNLLLDTQALLWFVLDDSRLSETARESIVAADARVFVSPASLWEIAIKTSLGKYTLPMPFATFWDDQLLTNDFALLPISVSHTARITDLPYHHRDPFDCQYAAYNGSPAVCVIMSPMAHFC